MHSFNATKTASQLGISYTPRPGLTVGVANGERVSCAGICAAASISIGHERFIIDLYVIPLDEYELVLGRHQWLKTLDPILWDFEWQSMAFWHDGRCVMWFGSTSASSPRLHEIACVDLLSLLLAEFADVFEQPITNAGLTTGSNCCQARRRCSCGHIATPAPQGRD
jgi:hypothetical protein